MRALGFLFLLILVIAAVGFWRGWFYVSSVEAGEHVGVGIDQSKIEADGRRIVEKTAEASKNATDALEAASLELADGTRELVTEIRGVDAEERELRVHVGGEDIALEVPAATPIESEGRSIEFRDLAAGQPVRLTLEDEDGDAGFRVTRVERL